MTPTQARKILHKRVPIAAVHWNVLDAKYRLLDVHPLEAVATLINALLTEPPTVVRAREKLLRAALRAEVDFLTFERDEARENLAAALARAEKAEGALATVEDVLAELIDIGRVHFARGPRMGHWDEALAAVRAARKEKK